MIVAIDCDYGVYIYNLFLTMHFGVEWLVFFFKLLNNNHLTEFPVDDSTSDGLSAGAVAGLAVALTLLVVLPVGVVLGCSGAWCIWRRGREHTCSTQVLVLVIC